MRARSALLISAVAWYALGVVALSACKRGAVRPEYIQKLKDECHAGKGEQCTQLGAVYDFGDGVARDRQQGAAFYKLGCDHADVWGCINLGMSLEFGLGVPKDITAAAALYERACDAGNGDGCFKLGALHDGMGPEVARDLVKSLRAYERSCTLGLSEGCAQLATAYRTGWTPAGKVPAEAARLYSVACGQQRDAIACLGLAAMQKRGEVAAADQESTRALVEDVVNSLDKGCKAGKAGQCMLLGLVYEIGDIVPGDRAQATQYYRLSCTHGNTVACAGAPSP